MDKHLPATQGSRYFCMVIMKVITINKILFALALLVGFSLPNVYEYPSFSFSQKVTVPQDQRKALNNDKLVFAEEFNGATLDSSTWSYEVGNGCPSLCGFGNNELQRYVSGDSNLQLKDGNLIITARRDPSNTKAFTSAKIFTRDKKVFKFGRIDLRAKLPAGQGIWPAFWMLPQNKRAGWPTSGELDILEMVGHEPGKVHGTLHFGPGPGSMQLTGSYVLPSGNFSDSFHIFSLDWRKDEIKWLVDGKEFASHSRPAFGNAEYPFNEDFYLILNLAVGGNWPGNPDHTTRFPQSFIVDYVRVYQ